MKKVMKIFLMLILGAMIALTSTQVFAEEDLTKELENDSEYEEAIEESDNEEKDKNEAKEENTNTNTNANLNANANNTNVNSNKNSTYTNTDLPKTGVEDVMPIAVLVVVFGISAVYAYKKISDYKNI